MLGISEGCISFPGFASTETTPARTERDWLILKQTRGCVVDRDMVMMMMMPLVSRRKAQCGNWGILKDLSTMKWCQPSNVIIFYSRNPQLVSPPREAFSTKSSDFMMRRRLSKGEPSNVFSWAKQIWKFVYYFDMQREKCWGGDTHFRERKLNLFGWLACWRRKIVMCSDADLKWNWNCDWKYLRL